MENQHRQIKGYRDLTQDEIDLMNEGKALAEQCGAFIDKLMKAEFAKTSDQEPDKRWAAIGRTHLQEGFMAAIRSIAKPTSF